jgi:hypothetical protein
MDESNRADRPALATGRNGDRLAEWPANVWPVQWMNQTAQIARLWCLADWPPQRTQDNGTELPTKSTYVFCVFWNSPAFSV